MPTVASQASMFHVKHALELLVYSELFCNTIYPLFQFFLLVCCVCLFFVGCTRPTEGNYSNTTVLKRLLFLQFCIRLSFKLLHIAFIQQTNLRMLTY